MKGRNSIPENVDSWCSTVYKRCKLIVGAQHTHGIQLESYGVTWSHIIKLLLSSNSLRLHFNDIVYFLTGSLCFEGPIRPIDAIKFDK